MHLTYGIEAGESSHTWSKVRGPLVSTLFGGTKSWSIMEPSSTEVGQVNLCFGCEIRILAP